MSRKNESDKVFWHKFDQFYESKLPLKANNILEIGVFKGNSIKYWRRKYSKSNIVGIDIVEEKECWPKDDKIQYFKLDQSNALGYNELLSNLSRKYDVIIEDGSHDPLHQKISLMESISFLEKGAMYILEDIHTSHKNHILYKKRAEYLNSKRGVFKKKTEDYFMTLQCVLLIEFLISNKIENCNLAELINFEHSIFTQYEIIMLIEKIKKIDIYKRSTLPNYCYSCGTSNYNLNSLKCKCGTNLYEFADSMTAILYF